MYRLLLESLHQIAPRQSPIDIKTDTLCFDKQKCQVGSLKLTYERGDCAKLRITPGHGWMVLAKEDSKTALTGSHLPSEYRFLQFHAHWSATSDCGSEHTVDGQSYAGEVHFVFWNTSYGTANDAMNQPDGVAVVGVFIKEGEFNVDYGHVTGLITEALQKGKDVPISKDLDMARLIPIGSDYFHYEGSLTTPPYTECVVWTVLLDHLEMSPNQFFHFRQICSENNRECQKLCGRKIFASKKFG